VAYATEGFDMFELMTQSIKEDTVRFCYNVSVETKAERKRVAEEGQEVKSDNAEEYLGAGAGGGAMSGAPEATEVPDREPAKEPVRRDHPKIGRNDPCPCGSGKKYKNCCGRSA
jgi:preprotein translocase subunit SecA